MTEIDNAAMLRLAHSTGFLQKEDPCVFRLNLADSQTERETGAGNRVGER